MHIFKIHLVLSITHLAGYTLDKCFISSTMEKVQYNCITKLERNCLETENMRICHNIPTFWDFVQFVVRNLAEDEHWKPYSQSPRNATTIFWLAFLCNSSTQLLALSKVSPRVIHGKYAVEPFLTCGVPDHKNDKKVKCLQPLISW